MPTIQRRKTTRRRKGPARPLLAAAGLALAVWGGLALLNSREAPPPAAEETTGITLVIDGTAPVIPQVLLDLAERNPETQALSITLAVATEKLISAGTMCREKSLTFSSGISAGAICPTVGTVRRI